MATTSTTASPAALPLLLRGNAGVQQLSHFMDAASTGVDSAPVIQPDVEDVQLSRDHTLILCTNKAAVTVRRADGSVACVLEEPSVISACVSPAASYILTYRRKTDDRPNLVIWAAADGRRLGALHCRPAACAVWPYVHWSADERVAFYARPEAEGPAVSVFRGDFSSDVPLAKVGCPGIAAITVLPGGPPYAVMGFVPRSKAKPATIGMWPYPGVAAPIASRSLQADTMRCEVDPSGQAVLVELRTERSADSYYGDSRLFLMSRDGKVNQAISLGKDGPTHDFAWNPRAGSSSCAFAVVGGASPPLTTFFDKKGNATFTCGSGPYNTVRFSPHGRWLLQGGFGSMPGDVTVWDTVRQAPVSPTFNLPCTVGVEWSPDGNSFLAFTTRPRLKVDNGFRVVRASGEVLLHTKVETLYQAIWGPSPGVTAEPTPLAVVPAGSAAKASAGAAPAPKAYRPPHSTGMVAAMMEADRKAAGKIGAASVAKIPGAATGPIGSGPPVMSDSAKRRAKARAKKAAESEAHAAETELQEALDAASPGTSASTPAPAGDEKAAASSAAAAAADAAAADPAKELKRLQKKLKQIEELEAAQDGGAALNADQLAKLSGKNDVLAGIRRAEAALAK